MEKVVAVGIEKLNCELFFRVFEILLCFSFCMCCSTAFQPLLEQSRSPVRHNLQINFVSDEPFFNHVFTKFPFLSELFNQDRLNFVL